MRFFTKVLLRIAPSKIVESCQQLVLDVVKHLPRLHYGLFHADVGTRVWWTTPFIGGVFYNVPSLSPQSSDLCFLHRWDRVHMATGTLVQKVRDGFRKLEAPLCKLKSGTFSTLNSKLTHTNIHIYTHSQVGSTIVLTSNPVTESTRAGRNCLHSIGITLPGQ